MMFALAVTLAVNVPIDYEINQWTVTTLPPDWTTTRDRWELYHTIRTFVSIAALGCVVASANAMHHAAVSSPANTRISILIAGIIAPPARPEARPQS